MVLMTQLYLQSASFYLELIQLSQHLRIFLLQFIFNFWLGFDVLLYKGSPNGRLLSATQAEIYLQNFEEQHITHKHNPP